MIVFNGGSTTGRDIFYNRKLATYRVIYYGQCGTCRALFYGGFEIPLSLITLDVKENPICG
jgi:hypothetical protein